MNAAQQLYDSFGNEIFAATIEKLKQEQNNKVDVINDQLTICTFPDGSKIMFENGFATVKNEFENEVTGIKLSDTVIKQLTWDDGSGSLIDAHVLRCTSHEGEMIIIYKGADNFTQEGYEGRINLQLTPRLQTISGTYTCRKGEVIFTLTGAFTNGEFTSFEGQWSELNWSSKFRFEAERVSAMMGSPRHCRDQVTTDRGGNGF